MALKIDPQDETLSAALQQVKETRKQAEAVAGWHQTTTTTAVLKEPRQNATVIANLSPQKRVYVAGAVGDYVRIESVQGNPPGYIARKAVTPSQREPEPTRGGLQAEEERHKLAEEERRKLEEEEKHRIEEERRRAGEMKRQRQSGLTIASLTSSARDSSVFPEYQRTFDQGFEAVWAAVHRALQEGKDQIARSDQQSGVIITNLTQHWEGIFPRYLQYYILVQEEMTGSSNVSFKLFTYFESITHSGILKPSSNAPDYAKRFIKQLEIMLASHDVNVATQDEKEAAESYPGAGLRRRRGRVAVVPAAR